MKRLTTALVLYAMAFTGACAQTPHSSTSNNIPLLLVGNKGDDSISFIDLTTGRELSRRPVSQSAPHEIASSPDGRHAAVVNYGSNVIDIFDIAKREIVHSFDLGDNKNPHGIVWRNDGRILATTEGGQSIIVLSAASQFKDRTLSAISTAQQGTHMLAVSPDGKTAYTANLGAGTVSKIDLIAGRTVKSVPSGQQPEGIAITPDGKEIWVSARGSNQVFVFNSALEQRTVIDVGRFPLRLAISPNGRKAVTSDLADGALSVIDIASRTLERTIKISGLQDTMQVTIVFSPDGSRIYAAETGINKIAEIDFESGKLLGRLSGGSQGDGLAIIP